MPELTVWVPGIPQPQGSARAFKRGDKVIVTSDNAKLRPWRDALRWHLQATHRGQPFVGNVELELEFTFPRPVGHFGKMGLRASAPSSHLIRPDLDKLCRAVLDALEESGVIRVDSQVGRIDAGKHYAGASGFALSPGCRVMVFAAESHIGPSHIPATEAALDEESAAAGSAGPASV